MITTFEELKPVLLKTKEKFSWTIYRDNIQASYEDMCFCPITACRFILDGERFHTNDFAIAAIGYIDKTCAELIVSASDSEERDSDLEIEVREWMIENLLS